MRGTAVLVVGDFDALGIIPAYAGNRDTRQSIDRNWWDHPRVCGEQFSSTLVNIGIPGSSPRMRGTVFKFTLDSRIRGIIPAYAGNSNITNRNTIEYRDHPRVCGEQSAAGSLAYCIKGSSPRMRGTGRSDNVSNVFPGIIPAYAGNRVIHHRSASPAVDHPRVCGEQDLLPVDIT